MQANNKAKNQQKRGTITEEIEKLKQRREDRKIKGTEEKKSDRVDNGKCDHEYETLIRKKKQVFNQEPEQVSLKF
jgi:hypothetical protein